MKTRLLIIALFVCASFAGYAQAGKTTFGVRAGVNFQNLNGKDADGDRLENDLKVGFHAGVNAEIPVADEFYLQPGVMISNKGAKINNALGSDDFKTSLTYLEIPINLLYKPVLGQGRLLMGFGPYIGFGVAGKVKVGDEKIDVKWENEVSANPVQLSAYYRRFDAGANLLFGYELTNNLSAQLNAQLGLVNIATKFQNVERPTVKNTGFGVSLGYRF